MSDAAFGLVFLAITLGLITWLWHRETMRMRNLPIIRPRRRRRR